jgi:hypothetical protein
MPFIFRIKCRSRVLILSSHSIFLPNCLHFPHTGRWQAIWCNLRTFLGRLETSLFSMKLAMWTRQIPFPVYFILTDNVYQLWLYECKKSHIPTIKQSICSIWNSKKVTCSCHKGKLKYRPSTCDVNNLHSKHEPFHQYTLYKWMKGR